MEVRLLIAFLLMGVVLAISNYFMPPQAQDADKQAKKETKQAPAATAQAAPAAAAAAPQAAPEVPGAVQAEQVEALTVDTDQYKVSFSNRGATVQNWVLKGLKSDSGKDLELVNQKAVQATGDKAIPAPFSLNFKNQPSNNPNDKLYKVTRSADGLTVDFEYSDGRLTAKKTFQFTKNSYLVKVSSQVVENGVLLPHALVWRGGFGDATGTNPTADARAVYYDTNDKSLEKKQASDAKNGPVAVSGNYAFAGLEDKYFAAVALPLAPGSLELTTYSDTLQTAEGKDEAHVGAAIGGSGNNTFQLFVGPKDDDLLAKVEPRLPQLLDWGWFGFLAKPLFFVLRFLATTVTHNYGWAIVLLTILINMALFPLKITSMKSSRKMQQIQPMVNAINEKYKGIPMNDPKAGQKNEELMELYKVHGINPVGGCLPLVIQIPFFYALYKALSIAIELRGAEWLWVGDLSQPEAWAIRLLPVLLVITQFLSQKMTPSPGMDPTQQKIMLLMPLMFGYMFWYASAGLVLYWLTSNVVSIAQQLLLNRTAAPAVAVVVPPKKKK